MINILEVREGLSRMTYDCPLDLKAIEDDGTFEGYGSVFGVEDSYKEVVERGAFRRTLREHRKRNSMPKLLWQHRTDLPIGVWGDMKEDQRGLFVRGRLLKDDVRLAAETYALIKAGAIDGLSIGFRSRKWNTDANTGIRTLTDVDLWEVSLVTFPANPDANVSAVKTAREFEEFLREAGLGIRS